LSKTEDVNKKAKSILEKYKGVIASRHKNSMDATSSPEKMSDSGSKHSHYTNSKLQEGKTVEITDKNDKIFIFTLMTYHRGKKLAAKNILENQRSIKLYVGFTQNKWPDFFLKQKQDGDYKFKIEDAISIKKCMSGLVEQYKDQIEAQANQIYENTVIRKLPTYLKKIAQSYPAFQKSIVDQLVKNFPRKDKPQIVSLLVY
jgi:hypothetical protein